MVVAKGVRVCACIYMYMHMYIYMYIHIYICGTLYIYTYTYVWVSGTLYTYTYTYMCMYRRHIHMCIYIMHQKPTCKFNSRSRNSAVERWGAGVETQKNIRGEVGGWGRVPFNEPYAPSLSTIYDGA